MTTIAAAGHSLTVLVPLQATAEPTQSNHEHPLHLAKLTGLLPPPDCHQNAASAANHRRPLFLHAGDPPIRPPRPG